MKLLNGQQVTLAATARRWLPVKGRINTQFEARCTPEVLKL